MRFSQLNVDINPIWIITVVIIDDFIHEISILKFVTARERDREIVRELFLLRYMIR